MSFNYRKRLGYDFVRVCVGVGGYYVVDCYLCGGGVVCCCCSFGPGGPSMSQEMASTSFRIVELEAEVAYFSSTMSELNRICSSPVTDDGLVRLHMGEVLAAAAGGCR